MSLKDKLVKLLGGYTEDEVSFLRQQSARIELFQEEFQSLRELISERARVAADSVNPDPGKAPTRAPIMTAPESWTKRRRRLEMEDLRRYRESQKAKNGDEGHGAEENLRQEYQ